VIQVPVVWLSFHAETIPRGYWDQTMLEDAFAGRLASMAPLSFKHFVIHAEPGDDDGLWPLADGCIVVVGARHHADRLHDINARITAYRWSIVVLTGDEEGVFPWAELDATVVMRQTPKIIDGQPLPDDGLWFGDGYTPTTRGVLASTLMEYTAKPEDLFFSGQVTHSRRKECVAALQSSQKVDATTGSVIATAGFTQGLEPVEYAQRLAAAKIAPCPSGPVSVDTFRVFEALEAGCVPIVDGRSPLYTQFTYWREVFGEGLPFPIVDDWRDGPQIIADTLKLWPAINNRCFVWWQGYKRSWALRIVEAVLEVSHAHAPLEVDQLITVVIPTSPIPSHPHTEILEETVASIRERLPTAEIRVVFDGVRPEQEHLRDQYEDYQRRALWLMNFVWHDVVPIRLETHHHQAMATRLALEGAETPCVLFVEHDTPILGDIPFHELSEAVMTGEANLIRLHHESSVLEPHRHLMVDEVPDVARAVPLLGTMQWSQRPHLASMQFYQGLLTKFFGEQSRTMIEDTMHGVLDYEWNHEGVAAWNRWRTFLYAPPGDMKRSTHLDGRAGEPMFDMTFEYDGDEIPPGAPYPSSRRVQ
jgi:hypothetical protein